MTSIDPIDVFISSTCYDLTDLRAVLNQHLIAHGFTTRLSDPSVESGFQVPGIGNTIAACLNNVESSKAVVVIIDGRYGPPLPGDTYGGNSATQVEVSHARGLIPAKPVFTFVRDHAWNEYDMLRDDPTAKTRWVEKGDDDRSKAKRAKWLSFMFELAKLPRHADWSNWCDNFRDVTDLVPLVTRRLIAAFPEHTGTLALHPDRLVRMIFAWNGRPDSTHIYGDFRNIGVGPALNVRYGLCVGVPGVAGGNEHFVERIGGIPAGERTSQPNPGHPRAYHVSDISSFVKVFCEYENRFRDRYRVEADFISRDGAYRPEDSFRHSESFYVAQGGPLDPRWAIVE